MINQNRENAKEKEDEESDDDRYACKMVWTIPWRMVCWADHLGPMKWGEFSRKDTSFFQDYKG